MVIKMLTKIKMFKKMMRRFRPTGESSRVGFWLRRVWLGLGMVFTVYLVIPGPAFPPPDLRDSIKSYLPGDTVQIENVAGYYTDLERDEVMAFYQDYFSRSSFLSLPLPVMNFNHRPEYSKQVWVDTMQSYYLEELVLPFRENLFVNGYTWQKDPFTPENKREQFALKYQGRIWDTKVSLRWFKAGIFTRVGLFWLVWGLALIIGLEWSRELSEFKLKNYEL